MTGALHVWSPAHAVLGGVLARSLHGPARIIVPAVGVILLVALGVLRRRRP